MEPILRSTTADKKWRNYEKEEKGKLFGGVRCRGTALVRVPDDRDAGAGGHIHVLTRNVPLSRAKEEISMARKVGFRQL